MTTVDGSTPDRVHRYPQLSPKAYEHPADRAATRTLGAIPRLHIVVRQLIELGYECALFQADLGSSPALGPSQLPDVGHRWTAVGEALDLGPTLPIYVAQSPAINAYTIGAKRPYAALSSLLVEVMDDDELTVVLAHETSHVLSQHVLYRTIPRIPLNLGSTAGVVPLAGIPLMAIRLALLEWFRAAELSCDRAAALVVGDPALVCRTLMVLGAGLPSSRLDADTFMVQARTYEVWDDGPDRLRRFLAQLGQTHFLPVRRANELMAWIASGEYDRIRRDDYITRDREPSAAETSRQAVDFYTNRFRSMFQTAGESVSKMGQRFADWARNPPDPEAHTIQAPDGSTDT